MTILKKDNNHDRLKRMKAPNGKMMLVTPSANDADAGELFGIWEDRPETKRSLRDKIWPKQILLIA